MYCGLFSHPPIFIETSQRYGPSRRETTGTNDILWRLLTSTYICAVYAPSFIVCVHTFPCRWHVCLCVWVLPVWSVLVFDIAVFVLTTKMWCADRASLCCWWHAFVSCVSSHARLLGYVDQVWPVHRQAGMYMCVRMWFVCDVHTHVCARACVGGCHGLWASQRVTWGSVAGGNVAGGKFEWEVHCE